jgi:Ca-activated chloride channel homolog
VAAARTLHQTDIQAVVNIIGFDVNDEAQKQLKEVATAGGGNYVTVKNQQELQKAFQADMDALMKLTQGWLDQSIQQKSNSFDKDVILLDENLNSMRATIHRERDRLVAALAYLHDQMYYDGTKQKGIDKWSWDRLFSLSTGYVDKKSVSIRTKMVEASMSSLHEVVDQNNENMNNIDEAKTHQK